VEQTQADRPPARPTAVVRADPFDPPPPLPEKAPRLRTEPSALSQSSVQAATPPARPATETAGPPPSEQTATAAAPSFWGKWPFNRLGKTERCLMPGCTWSPPQERPSR
jgi:hypothetical protein